MSGVERRHFERVPVRIPVRIFVSGYDEAIEGEILNISEGGAFIESNRRVQKGEKILIELAFAELQLLHGRVVDMNRDLPEGKNVEPSVVRWIHKLSENGFGVEFTELKPEVKRFLEELIRYCSEA